MTEFVDGVIRIRPTRRDELATIAALEIAGDTARFVTAESVDRHASELARPECVYRSIVSEADGRLVGFIILVLEGDGESVELRRIVIAERGQGFGTRAMKLAERECRESYRRRRIWLDVFHFNERARHVYESNGYVVTGTGELHGETLYFLEKPL